MPYRRLLNCLPDACFIVNGEGAIAAANHAACEIFSLTPEEMCTRKFGDLLEPGMHMAAQQAVTESLKSGQVRKLEAKSPHANTPASDIEFHIAPFAEQDDAPSDKCIVSAYDVTEAKRKELDLLRFSNVAHYTVNPLEITDISGKIIYVNPAFEKASGFSKEELIGKNPNIFGSGKYPKSFWKKMWDTINAGKVWAGEIENRRRNGEPFLTQILISPIIDASGTTTGYFAVHRDVTQERFMEQQYVHAQKMESIGMLAAGIAHEVGNPLTSISSIVQVIERTTSDQFTREKLGLIKSQVTRISKIIRDLVDFSRRSSYEVQVTNLNKCITDAVEIVRLGKKAKSVVFDVDLNASLPMLPLVPDQIEQIFINILINAIDAVSEPNPARVGPGKISVRSYAVDENVAVAIEDNGKGIPEETMPKIFEPFFTTKKVGEGTGLGLWVSYGIVKSFQGTITAETIKGSGAKFVIAFPLKREM
jgi:PAS domain S-box-containing protein